MISREECKKRLRKITTETEKRIAKISEEEIKRVYDRRTATIKKTLVVQKGYVGLAKLSAEIGDINEVAKLLVKARICKDNVYAFVLGANPNQGGIVEITPEMIRGVEKAGENPYVKETQRIYQEGEDDCLSKLEGLVQR